MNLLIIGDGEEKNSLMRLSKSMSLDKYIWFYGDSYDESEIGNLIQNCHLCVSPGNVGLTSIHSMSFGKPVITNDDYKNQMPEFEIIVEGETGYFFKSDSITSMSSKIEKLLLSEKKVNYEKNCIRKIEEFYNPNFQINTILSILHEK